MEDGKAYDTSDEAEVMQVLFVDAAVGVDDGRVCVLVGVLRKGE